MEGYSKKDYHVALERWFINSNSLKIDTMSKNRQPDDNSNAKGKHLMPEKAARYTGKEPGTGGPGETKALVPPSCY